MITVTLLLIGYGMIRLHKKRIDKCIEPHRAEELPDKIEV